MADRPPLYDDLGQTNSSNGGSRLNFSTNIPGSIFSADELVSSTSPAADDQSRRTSYAEAQLPPSRDSNDQDTLYDFRQPEAGHEEQEVTPFIPRVNTELPGYAQATDPEQQPPAYEREPKSKRLSRDRHEKKKLLVLGVVVSVIMLIGICVGTIRARQQHQQDVSHRPKSTSVPTQFVPTGLTIAPGTARPTDSPSLYPEVVQNNRIFNPTLFSYTGVSIFDWASTPTNCWTTGGRERYLLGNGTYGHTENHDPAGCTMQTDFRGYSEEENSTTWWVTMQYYAPPPTANFSATSKSASTGNSSTSSTNTVDDDSRLIVSIWTEKEKLVLLNTTAATVDRSKNFTTASWLVGLSVQPVNILVEAWNKNGYWDVTNVNALAIPPKAVESQRV